MSEHDLKTELASKIAGLMPKIRTDLERLVRIPSVGFPGFDPAHVRDSAAATAEILGSAGFEGVEVIEVPRGHPAVYAEAAGPEGTPTILLYAHHDVQPEGPVEQWTSPPFEPQVRAGRLYGRGSCDDKAGIVMHAAALMAFDGRPPVNLKVIVEGEEECTTEHLDFLVRDHAELLRADAVVVADSGNWAKGVPALTTSLRGAIEVRVELRTLEKALHSGAYGGPIPDAIMAMSRLLASLHNDDGSIAVDGLARGTAEGAPAIDERGFREEAGVLEGVALLDGGPLADHIWRGTSITVVGMDVPSVRSASWQLVPVARATVTMRIPPGQDPQAAAEALTHHLEANVPWGAKADIEVVDTSQPFETPPTGRYFRAHSRALADAWGVDPVYMGEGGSVPIVPLLAEVMPGIEVLLTGPGDEENAAHSLDESIDLVELERSCLAEALFFAHAAMEEDR